MKEEEYGIGIGSDRDRSADLPGSDGNGLWIKRRMALGGGCTWNRRPFSKPEAHCCVGDNDHRNLDPGGKILLHSHFGPWCGQNLFSTGSSDCHRPPLAVET